MKELRVLHVDSGRVWRGGQRQVFLLAQGLKRRGHTQRILAPPDSPLLQRAAKAGLDVEPLVMRYDWDVRAALAIRAKIRDLKIDIVHAHDARSHSFARLALIGLAHPPLVVTRRVPYVPKAARLKYGNRVTRFIAVSGAVKNAMVEAGIDATRIVVVHSGVEDPPANLQPRDWRNELGWPYDVVICGVVGAMTAEKGIDDLESISSALSDEARARTKVLLLGGEKRGRLKIGGLDAYSAGFIEDIIPAVAGLDVLWHPSRAEGLGTAVIDGMALGVPPVAYSVGGLSEVVENRTNGLLVRSGDADGFAKAAEQLIMDPSLRASLAESARVRAKAFSVETMTRGTEQVYNELISGGEKHSQPSILRGTPA